MKVLYLNDYSLADTFREVQKGADHAAHLWGYDYFCSHESAECVPLNERCLALQKRLGLYFLIGDLCQQAVVLRKKRDVGVVVAANINLIWGLSYLKRFMRLPPLAAIIHSVPRFKNSLYRIFLRSRLKGVDKILCLTKKDYDYLKEHIHIPAGRLEYLPWAANLADYERSSVPPVSLSSGSYVISMGKSRRDYPTLIKAFSQLNDPSVSLKIYPGNSFALSKPTSKVGVVNKWISFKDSTALYQQALFVVIPIKKTDRTIGLTSLFDAMAVGKALIMTRNPGIDIEIEKEEIGFWVEPGDVEGLKEKISYFIHHPDVAERFGQNGRRFLKDRYNYRMFCEKLYAAIREIRRDS